MPLGRRHAATQEIDALDARDSCHQRRLRRRQVRQVGRHRQKVLRVVRDGVARGAKVAFFDIGGVNSNGQGYLSVPQSSAAIFDPGYNAGARIHSASWGDVISPWVDGALTEDSYGYGFGAVDDA